MELFCVATGSSGNCYILTSSNGEKRILDCGISIKEIKKGLDWNINAVVGAVCTHRHKDHSKSLQQIRNMGIQIFAPYELGNVKTAHCKLGCFDVTAFDVPHNNCWNNGFLIKVDGQKVVYMTDYEYCPYNFSKLEINHFLIECNYIKDMLNTSIPNFEHKVRGHAELETVKQFVQVNKSDELQTVILCHLGQESTDKDRIISEIKKLVPMANVDVAEPNKKWILKKGDECPF